MSEVDQTTYQKIGDKNKALKDKFKKKEKGVVVAKVDNKEEMQSKAMKDRMDKEKC